MKTENKQNKKVSNKHIPVINTDNSNQNNIQDESFDISDLYKEENGANKLLEQFNQDIDINYQSSVQTDNTEGFNDSSDRVGADEILYQVGNTNDAIDKLINTLIDFIEPVDFLQYVRNRYDISEEALHKYQMNDDSLKYKYIAIVIVNQLLETAKQNNMDIAIAYEGDKELFYMYHEKYWQNIPYNYIVRLLLHVSTKMGYSQLESQLPVFYKQLEATFNLAVIKNSELKTYFDPDVTLFNLNNYILKITRKSITAIPHDKKYGLKYKLDYDYNPEAQAPEFIKYLNRVLPDKDSQLVALEALAMPFIPKAIKMTTCPVFYGEGANGKTVLFDIAKYLYGAMMSSLSLQDLMCQFNRVHIQNVLVNYCDEMNGKNLIPDTIKNLISGTRIQASHKNKPTFVMENYARLICNSNSYPNANEIGLAFVRRWLYIYFNQMIPVEEQDHELANRIINQELSGILNLVIAGLERLRTNNHKFSQCENSEKLRQEFIKQADVVSIFLEYKDYIPDQYNKIKLKDLHEQLVEFCIKFKHEITIKQPQQLAEKLRSLKFIVKQGGGGKNYVFIKAVPPQDD